VATTTDEPPTHRALQLERLTLWWVDGGMLRTAELDPAAMPEQLLDGTVVWAHWELAGTEVEAGEEPEMDDFLDLLGDQGTEMRRWIWNLTLPWVGGGFRAAAPSLGSARRATFFDAVASEIRFELRSGLLTQEGLEQKRPIVQRTLLAGLALEGLLLTVRFPTTDNHRERPPAEEEDDSGDDYRWRAWDLERTLSSAHGVTSSGELRSGDVLTAITLDILRAADRMRSWFVTDLEELDFAQLQIHGDEPDAEERRTELQRRYRWLLERITELRVALEWEWDERDSLVDHFSGSESLIAIGSLRIRQLSELYNLKQDVRASLDLFSTVLTQEALELTRAEQQQTREILELTRVEQRRSEGLHTAVTYISAVVLVPGLVTGVFDALPSILERQHVARASLMFGTMLLSGLVTFFWMRSWAGGED
jgi:hypothetical protein